VDARSNSPTALDARAEGTVRVWDPIVRFFHWTVAAGCAINLLLQGGGRLHRGIGYAVALAVAIRVIWGFIGSGHARFDSFIPRPGALWRYLDELRRAREPRYVGHNPAGAVMIVALLAVLVGISATGWLLRLDAFFGNQTLEELHESMATALLALVVLHVLAAIVESVRHRENLIQSMWTGRKRAAAVRDIDNAVDSH
jgi:cytochrome b